MRRLFWKLFLAFALALIAIDISHPLALQFARALHFEIAANTHTTNALLALFINLCVSAALAWYLSRPIRILRRAFGALAQGKFDTRVLHLLGSRRDGIADLGRDFDSLALKLQHLFGAQQRVVQEVSHELRSPLTRLQVAIGLAQQDPQKLHVTLDRIHSESLELQYMLENMLALAQVEMGGRQLRPERIDVLALLADIARDARYEAQASGRELSLRGEGECFISAHAHLLQRAFENVLRNAVKYTQPGTCVEVEATRNGAELLLTVADRGPGVDAALLPLLFEPFYRAPEQRRHTQGFGLGLALAHSAVEMHGGNITAMNRPGGGLIVIISLPH